MNRDRDTGSFVRFVVLGLGNAAWSFALYAVLVVVLQWHYLLSLAIVWTAGFVVSYVANFLWVFRTAERLRLRRNLARFVLLFWGMFAFNSLILSLLTEGLRIQPLLAQVIAIPLVVILNYLGGRHWAFRRDASPPGEGRY